MIPLLASGQREEVQISLPKMSQSIIHRQESPDERMHEKPGIKEVVKGRGKPTVTCIKGQSSP